MVGHACLRGLVTPSLTELTPRRCPRLSLRATLRERAASPEAQCYGPAHRQLSRGARGQGPRTPDCGCLGLRPWQGRAQFESSVTPASRRGGLCAA